MSTKSQLMMMPPSLKQALRAIDRRRRASSLLEGLGRLTLWLAALVLAGALLDLAAPLPKAARWLVWCLALLLTLFVFWRRLARPQLERLGWVELAAMAEQRDPTLGEQISQAAAFSQEGEHAHGSPGLISAAVAAGDQQGSRVAPSQVVPTGASWRWAGLGASALAAIITSAIVWPDPCGTLVERFLMPWNDRPRVSRYLVEIEGGDRVVAIGDDVNIHAKVHSRFGAISPRTQTSLRWRDQQGRDHQMAMANATEGSKTDQPRYQLTLPRIAGSLSLRAVIAGAESQPVQVTALQPPEVQTLVATVEPPTYLGLPPATFTDPARLEAWQDSQIRFNLTASRALQTVALNWPREEENEPQVRASKPAKPPIGMNSVEGSEGRQWSASAQAVEPGPFTFALRDHQGLASRDELGRARQLLVRIDQAPTIELASPFTRSQDQTPEETQADDVLTVGFQAHDDVAVAAVELHYEINRAGGVAGFSSPADQPEAKGETSFVPVTTLPDLKDSRFQAISGQAVLPLSRLGLQAGDELTYRARVLDNNPPPRGPGEGWSLGRSLRIVDKSTPLVAQRQAAAQKRLQQKLDELKAAAAQNRQATEQLRYAADAARKNNGPWDAARQEALTDQEQAARDLADRMQILARELSQNDSDFQELAQPLAETADVEAEAAREALSEAAEATDATDRLDDLKQADNRQAALQNRLNELQKTFDQASRDAADRATLATLAERQQALADQARDLADDALRTDRATLDLLDVEQAKLSRELEEILSRSPALKAEALAARGKTAATLADAARALADRQRDEARQTGDLSAQARPLQELAEAQQELEAEARRLATDIDEPLSENERGRVNINALTEAREALNRGELDQIRTRMETAENDLRRVAREVQEARTDPRALARRLQKRQERLQEEATRTLRETVKDRNRPRDEEIAELQTRLEPLLARQEAIQKLLEPLAAPPDQEHLKREAADRQQRAAQSLDVQNFRDLENRQREARETLKRLADGLPDPNRLRNEANRPIDESRRAVEQVARDVERHLRETAPQKGRPYNPQKANEDLANRLRGLVETQRQSVKRLSEMKSRDHIEPQRSRARDRANTLIKGLETADREALPAMVRDARSALDRLSQKNNGQPLPADDLAEELAQEAQAITGEENQTPDQWRGLAAAIRSLAAPDAGLERAVALSAAETAATAEPGDDQEAATRQALAAVNSLSRRLADTAHARAQVETLALAAKLETPASQQAATLREIGEQLARISLSQSLDTQAVKPAAQAVARARDLAENLPSATSPIAALAELDQARAEAATRLQALAPSIDPQKPADQQPPPAPALAAVNNDPELRLKPEQAEQASDLARKQRRLREQVQTLLADRVPSQLEVQRQSQELGRELAALRESLQPISPRSRAQAAQAADLLENQAPQTMRQAVDQLEQGQATTAKDSQRRAAETLERAAQRAEDLASILQAEASQNAQNQQQQQPPPGQNLVEAQSAQQAARDQLAQARNSTRPDGQDQQQQQAPATRAQQAMQQAATSLRSAAQAQSSQRGSQALSQPGQQQAQAGEPNPAENPDPQSQPAGTVEAELARLQQQIQASTGRSWGELPGHLQTEILQMSRTGYRDDYTRLIQLYFREIAAARAGSKTTTQPSPRP